jgi:GTP-sensing pleiotropic transcriptional regulator CodY
MKMSSVQLLDKTRKIGKLLHNNNSSKVVFNDICNVLKEILQSNVLVISKKGKILGVGRTDGSRRWMSCLKARSASLWTVF